jgi:hypothetical protein
MGIRIDEGKRVTGEKKINGEGRKADNTAGG